MIITRFKNTPPIHKFNPSYEYDIYENEINIEGLANKVLKLEKTILSETEKSIAHDGDTGLGNDSLTSRFTQFNLFQIEETKFLKEIIKHEVKLYTNRLDQVDSCPLDTLLYGQCWANVMRKGEVIRVHSHASWKLGDYSYLSGNICVQTNETSTYYLTPYYEHTYQLQNKDGTIVLFPSWLKHYTDDVKNDEERITLGFDLINIEGYEKGIIDERKYHWEKLFNKDDETPQP